MYADGKLLSSVLIRRRIFQEDSFSPSVFVIVLLPMTHGLRETRIGYQLEKKGASLNHLFFMNDLKPYVTNDKEMGSMIKTVWQCSEDIKMEFGISKYAVVSLQREKKVRWEVIHRYIRVASRVAERLIT